MIVYSERYQEHNQEHHPENNLRLLRIMRLLTKKDVFEEIPLFEPRAARREDLLRVHRLEHLENIRRLSESGGTTIGMDTYLTSQSYEIAKLSAGGVITCVDKFYEGYRYSFALVRPPGHHAEQSVAMGFCLFNNVAIAARYAIAKYGVEKILILDYDVHHGNGTQEIFYSDPRVFYVSLHQYPHYPGTGSIEEWGEGKGMGYNLNIPLPPKTSDRSYLKAMDEVVLPAMRKYKPELVFVSAGYDAHHSDPLGGLELSHSCYYEVAQRLKENSPGIIYALEGGYSLEALATSVYATLIPIFDLKDEALEPPREEDPRVTRYVDTRIAIIKDKFDL
jgi:acetoin utilization deacetylase AcuC-like enzyme